MSVWDAIAEAEAILPGQPAQDGAIDPCWQAIMTVEDFVRDEPEAVWNFILRWGCHADEDLRTAVATCLLEDLLKYTSQTSSLKSPPQWSRTSCLRTLSGDAGSSARLNKKEMPSASITCSRNAGSNRNEIDILFLRLDDIGETRAGSHARQKTHDQIA